MRRVAESFASMKGGGAHKGAAADGAAAPAGQRRLLHNGAAAPKTLAACLMATADMRASILLSLGMLHGAAAGGSFRSCPPCGESTVPSGVVAVNTTAVLGTPVAMNNVSQGMVVPRNDEHVSKWIITYKEPFEKPVLARMLSYVRPGGVVLDIGANLGTYTIWFARSVGAAGKVWAFEPQPYVFQVLCANVVLNGHRNVETVNTALSFKAGIAHMEATLPDGVSRGASFADVATNHDTKVNYGGRRLGAGGERVPMITLDSMNLSQVDFIKMDVQGAEPLVVWGARETIKRCQPVVTFEESAEFKVTEGMRTELGIPEEVMNFTISGFLQDLGYTPVETIQSDDKFWVPKGYAERA